MTRTPVAREPGVYSYAGLTPNSPGLVRLFGAADLFVLPTLDDTFAQVNSGGDGERVAGGRQPRGRDSRARGGG